MSIQQTGFKLAQTIISNGQTTGNPWSNPNNLLLVDGDISESNPSQGVASDVILGNFNTNLPQDAIITGIQIKIFGYRGAQTSPVITLSPNAVDNTSGTDVFYPYVTPFTGLTPTMDEYILGGQNYLFDTTWDADKVNNFKLQLVSNGDIYLDAAQINVFYYIPETPTPTPVITDNCETCNSQIQAQPFYLALAFKVGETKFRLKNFKFPNGTDITYADLGDCGGYIDFVFDPGKPLVQGSNFEENVRCSSWVVLADGTVEFDIVSTSFRGLSYHEPITSDASRMSDHDVNSQVIISNNSPFYERFLKRCHIGVLVSDIIKTDKDGTNVVPVTTTFNFIGENVEVDQDISDSEQANVTVLTNPTNVVPEVEETSEGFTNGATSLTISHEIIDANYLRVWVSTEDETITSVEYDGVAMTLVGTETNGPANLKVALYGLVNPNVGVNDIIITMGASVAISGGGVSFKNVDTSNPTAVVSSGAIGTSTAPSDTITTVVDNTIVQDVVGAVTNATTITQASPWTIQSDINAADRPGASSTRKVLAPTTISDTYTIGPSQAWAIILAGIRGAVASNATIIVEDEGTPVADPVNTLNFIGAGVTATQVSPGVVEVDIPGGGSGLDLETNGTPNGDQTLLNLVAGTNMTITDDGNGNITFDATGGGGSGEVVQKTITQTAHGFSIGDVLKSSGVDGEFALAEADVVTNADAIGIVTSVPTVNTFVLTTEGFEVISVLPVGAVAGDNLFLSDSVAGALTLTDPAIANVPGTVSFPLGTVIDASSGLCNIHKYRPQEQQSTPVVSSSHTVNADETITDEYAVTVKPFATTDGWNTPSNGNTTTTGTVIKGGGIEQWIGTTGANAAGLSWTTPIFTSTEARLRFVIQQLSTDGREELQIGFQNAYINVPQGGASVEAKTTNGGTTTTTLGTITPGIKHIYEIVFSTIDASVKFYVDGVLLATHTTNIPSSVSSLDIVERLAYVSGSGGTSKFFISNLTLAYSI